MHKVKTNLSALDDLQNEIDMLNDFKSTQNNGIFKEDSEYSKKRSVSWQKFKLGDLVSITTGKLDANAQTENGKYKFFTCAKESFNIDNYAFDMEALLISGNGANVGYIHYYDGKFNAYQRTYVLSDFKVDAKFLQFFLEKNLASRINQEKNSGSMPYIVLETIAGMNVFVPPVLEQKKIAEFFTFLDQRIEKQIEKVEALKEYKKGIQQKIFNRELVFTDDSGNAYPEWEKKKLREIAQVLRGNGLSKASISENGQTPCILYGQLFSLYGTSITKIMSHTNETSSMVGKKGDILMPTSDVTPGGLATASCLFQDGVLLGSDMNIIRLTKKIFPLFLTYQISFYKKKIIDKVSGTTVKHIYPKDLLDLTYFAPALPEQEKIAELFSALDKQIELNEKKITFLKEQKKGYLQMIFK